MFDDFVEDVKIQLVKRRLILTFKELSKRIDINYGTLTEFMRKKNDSRNTAEKIADFFDMAMLYQQGKYRLVEKDEH